MKTTFHQMIFLADSRVLFHCSCYLAPIVRGDFDVLVGQPDCLVSTSEMEYYEGEDGSFDMI